MPDALTARRTGIDLLNAFSEGFDQLAIDLDGFDPDGGLTRLAQQIAAVAADMRHRWNLEIAE